MATDFNQFISEAAIIARKASRHGQTVPMEHVQREARHHVRQRAESQERPIDADRMKIVSTALADAAFDMIKLYQRADQLEAWPPNRGEVWNG